MTRAAPDKLAQRIAELGPWFHNLRLHGIETAPDHFLGDYPAFKWQGFRHAVPEDLAGRSVLDIGCNAGFYALEMARRGASRVLAVDADPHYLAQARLAAEVTGAAAIEFRQMSVYEMADLGERFDLVVFMGVFYHLRHPLLALDLIRRHALAPGGQMLFQTMLRGSDRVAEVPQDAPFDDAAMFGQDGFPLAHFIEHAYAGDPSNWFVPNRAGAEAMLRASGFAPVLHPEPEVWLCDASPPGWDAEDQLPRALR